MTRTSSKCCRGGKLKLIVWQTNNWVRPKHPQIFLSIVKLTKCSHNLKHHAFKSFNSNGFTFPYFKVSSPLISFLTYDRRTQKILINDIYNKINSMGMKLKPSKCWSFSIESGRPEIVHFYIERYKMDEDIGRNSSIH